MAILRSAFDPGGTSRSTQDHPQQLRLISEVDKLPPDASVAQLDRASVFGTEGLRFESSRVHYEPQRLTSSGSFLSDPDVPRHTLVDLIDVPATGLGSTPRLRKHKNGRLAEHRTTAFLLDHFWVLKQSLDLDGACSSSKPRLATTVAASAVCG